jgi:phenylalanyl-tRNA synthetase beta subunit
MLDQSEAADYVPVSRFPKVEQDITLRVPSGLPYGKLDTFITEELYQVQNAHFTLTPLDIFQQEDSHKNITFRIALSSYDRTLKAEEVNKLLDGIAAKAAESLQAERV